MNYSCDTMTDNGRLWWDCTVDLIDQHDSFYEALIEGKGSSFHVIAGPQINGRFLCIPNWQIGCELGQLDDVFWNSEQLIRHLNRIDTRTVAVGLSHPDIGDYSG